MATARDRLYLDACVINRLTDQSAESRVREEAVAVTHVFDGISAGDAIWIASDFLYTELHRNPDPETRGIALDLMTFAAEFVQDSQSIRSRAEVLHKSGFQLFDALHIAAAEQANTNVLLTVDDRLIRRAQRTSLSLSILNPVDWLQGRPQ